MMRSHQDIYSTFAATADRRGDHPAVIYLGSKFSYSRIRELAGRLAAALTDLGVASGQTVMMYIPNSIHWVISWLAIQKIRAVSLPITPIYTPHDLKYIANDSNAETIICADTNFGYVTSVLPDTRLKRVIVSNAAELLPWYKRWFGSLFDVVPRGKFSLNAQTARLQAVRTRPQ